MGNYSRNTFDKDTFNKLKNYVSVRLQQGVPLVDADWNEKDDIRRFEIEAFLKWFIGDGVPKGSDAFLIESAANRIYLGAPASAKSQRLLIEIDVDANTSSAAAGLGFDPDNFKMEAISPPAQLTGKVNNPSVKAGDKLRLRIGDPPANDWVTLAFNADLTGADLAKAIADALPPSLQGKLAVGVGSPDDLVIKGGDGKGGVGLCLVEGWDVMTFGDQIFKPSLTSDKTVFYLDIWEQEIDSDDDQELKDSRIGMETCVRIQRAWAVRQADITDPADYLKGIQRDPGHVYYPLATLTKAGVLEDVRCTCLATLPGEITVSHGKVGIGTQTLTGKLTVKGDSPYHGSLTFFSPDTDVKYDGGLDRLFVFTNTGDTTAFIGGKIGIGTTSPNAKLTISTENNRDGIFLSGKRKAVALFTNNTQWAWNGLTQDGDHLLLWLGEDVDKLSSGLVIAPWRNSPSGIRIDANGNVGIGTADPKASLHVINSLAVGPFSRESAVGRLTLTGSSAGLGLVRRTLTAWPDTPVAGDRFVWYNPDGSARLFTEVIGDLISVTSTGGVGIGTTSPDPNFKLDVNGALKVAGHNIVWGNNSTLSADQGDSIELGGNGVGTPYIDFHYKDKVGQDFNTRIINDDDGQLTLARRLG